MPFWPLAAPGRAACFAALASAPLLIMLWRKRSLARALYSVVSWCFNAAGLVLGLAHRRRAARGLIPSRVLREPPQALEPRYERFA